MTESPIKRVFDNLTHLLSDTVIYPEANTHNEYTSSMLGVWVGASTYKVLVEIESFSKTAHTR